MGKMNYFRLVEIGLVWAFKKTWGRSNHLASLYFLSLFWYVCIGGHQGSLNQLRKACTLRPVLGQGPLECGPLKIDPATKKPRQTLFPSLFFSVSSRGLSITLRGYTLNGHFVLGFSTLQTPSNRKSINVTPHHICLRESELKTSGYVIVENSYFR